MSCNPSDSDGLESLIQGFWPQLCCLELDRSLANAAIWDILDLEPRCLLGLHSKLKAMAILSVPRAKAQKKVLLTLPSNPEISFCYCPPSRLEDGTRQKRKYPGADERYT